jgi:molybdenum-dependent DNA-binding transcriptional regulator ModE
MARGRKPKVTTVLTQAEQELKEVYSVRMNDLDVLYKDLAKLKDKVNYALRHIGMIDECGTIAEAAFKAGRVYGPLDEVNDKLEEMLEHLYETNDFDHWDDVTTCC